MKKIAVIMIGIQSSGKTEYVNRYLKGRYTAIGSDTLYTENSEMYAVMNCIRDGENFVIDSINQKKADRAKYIALARKNNYRVMGIYMESVLPYCLERNKKRGRRKVPEDIIRGTLKGFEIPHYSEGFDDLYLMKIRGNCTYSSEWKN
ncbi:MAG: ATP-binding protein [Clostridia bacterium]|nr:ATP-binding protein [Clostridia bacterium]